MAPRPAMESRLNRGRVFQTHGGAKHAVPCARLLDALLERLIVAQMSDGGPDNDETGNDDASDETWQHKNPCISVYLGIAGRVSRRTLYHAVCHIFQSSRTATALMAGSVSPTRSGGWKKQSGNRRVGADVSALGGGGAREWVLIKLTADIDRFRGTRPDQLREPEISITGIRTHAELDIELWVAWLVGVLTTWCSPGFPEPATHARVSASLRGGVGCVFFFFVCFWKKAAKRGREGEEKKPIRKLWGALASESARVVDSNPLDLHTIAIQFFSHPLILARSSLSLNCRPGQVPPCSLRIASESASCSASMYQLVPGFLFLRLLLPSRAAASLSLVPGCSLANPLELPCRPQLICARSPLKSLLVSGPCRLTRADVHGSQDRVGWVARRTLVYMYIWNPRNHLLFPATFLVQIPSCSCSCSYIRVRRRVLDRPTPHYAT